VVLQQKVIIVSGAVLRDDLFSRLFSFSRLRGQKQLSKPPLTAGSKPLVTASRDPQPRPSHGQAGRNSTHVLQTLFGPQRQYWEVSTLATERTTSTGVTCSASGPVLDSQGCSPQVERVCRVD